MFNLQVKSGCYLKPTDHVAQSTHILLTTEITTGTDPTELASDRPRWATHVLAFWLQNLFKLNNGHLKQ